MGGRHEIALALPGKLTRSLRGLLLCVSPRFFGLLLCVLSSLLHRPLFVSTPSGYRPLFGPTSSRIDSLLHRPLLYVCRRLFVEEISKTAAGGHRLLRLATIDFVTPKVSTSISKTDSVFGAGFVQWSVVFVFKNRVEPKIGVTSCQSAS